MRFRLQYGRESHDVEIPDENLPTASPAILRDHAARLYPQAHLPTLKLIAQGKTLADDTALADLAAPNRAVVTVLLVAAKADEVAAFAEVESRRKLIEARVRDDRELEPVTRLSTAKFVHEAFSKHQRQMALARSDERFGFGEVRALPGFADADAVVERLQRIALHAGVLAVMKAHKWFVPVLSEMYPDGKVGVDPVCVLGLNVNKGQEIKLRLRTDDLAGFRKADVVWKTVWHELAHNEISEHTGAFYDFVSSLTREGAAGDWRSNGGHRIDGDAARGDGWGSDDRFVQLAAHTASSRGGPAFVGGSGTAGGALGGAGLLGIDSAVDPDVAAAVRAEAARRRLGAGVSAAGAGRAEASVTTVIPPRSPSPASAAALSAPLSQKMEEDAEIVPSRHMDGCSCGAHSATHGASPSITAAADAPQVGRSASHTSSTSVGVESARSFARSAPDEADSVSGTAAHPGSSTHPPAVAPAACLVGDEQKASWRRALEEALSEAVAECLVAGVAVREALTTVLGIFTRAADALQSLAQTGVGLRDPPSAAQLSAAEASKYLRLKPHNLAFKARTGAGPAVLHLLQAAGFVPDDHCDVTGSGSRDSAEAGIHIIAAAADGEGVERLAVAREVVMGALSTL
jgi:hypothetical protein